MARYRDHLPQLDGTLFLTDGGIETSLIFQDGQELPEFAAFHLLASDAGAAALRRYFTRHAAIALETETGFILESPTWRASTDWGERLGYSRQALVDANLRSIALMHDLRTELETPRSPMVVSGCIGPRGDGYDASHRMTPQQAADYHDFQARLFAASDADQITAITMTHSGEAAGIALAARAENVPSVISFTVETDGRLPTGQPLGEAISEVDEITGNAPAYYMINCAHPTHFENRLGDAEWVRRIRGLRANASRLSHAELDEAEALDRGDPQELAAEYAALRERFPWINVLGGCCGTDEQHIHFIAAACRS